MKPASAPAQRLRRQYQRLRAGLARIDLIAQGTVLARHDSRRASNSTPYYQWSQKHANQTRSVNLSRKQYQRLQQAIAQNRKLEETLRKMRLLSQAIIFRTTPDIQRRDPAKTRVLCAI